MFDRHNVFEVLTADGAEGGGGPSLGGFDDDDPDVTEIITLGPGEEPPSEEDEGDGIDEDKVTLSKEEYEQLRSGKDSTGILAEGLKELKDVLGQQNAPANLKQQPGESDEDFEKRLEQDLFAEGKSGKTLREAIERYSGRQHQQLMSVISQQNRRLLELDGTKGPVFKRFQSEIEGFVGQLPPEQQNHPQVWDYAFEQVKKRHESELQEETVNEQVERLVAERLKAYGIDGQEEEGKGKPKRRASYMESGKGSANRSSGQKKRKVVYATAEDREMAQRRMIPLEEYLKRKGKL